MKRIPNHGRIAPDELLVRLDQFYRDMMDARPGDSSDTDICFEDFAHAVAEEWPIIRARLSNTSTACYAAGVTGTGDKASRSDARGCQVHYAAGSDSAAYGAGNNSGVQQLVGRRSGLV